MRRRPLLVTASVAATAGIVGCTGSETTGVEVLDRELADAADGETTMRVQVENGGEGGHIEVAVDLAWTADGADERNSSSPALENRDFRHRQKSAPRSVGPLGSFAPLSDERAKLSRTPSTPSRQDAEGEVFETYSDVVGLDAGERRWVDVPVRRYPDRESDYEYRVAASRTDRPLARFDHDSEEPGVGDVLRFDASSSRVVDGAIAAYDWSIGDAYEVGREIEYRLDEADADGLAVELRVTDTQGAFDTARRRIELDG